MSNEIKQAKRLIKFEVDFAIEEVERVADQNDFDRSWMLEEFRSQIVTRINKILKGE